MPDSNPSSEATVELVVTDIHLAEALATEPGESFPAVFSTPWLLAQLERAAAKALHPVLEEGQLSVGARVSLDHVAPTRAGSRIRAHARFERTEGPLYLFEVWAEDEAGVVARGTHARAVAPKAAVERRAQKRAEQAAAS